MTWYANSPIVSVLLATGIAWIAPQFLVACTVYSIVMFMFVIIVSASALSWTSGVSLFSISLALGYLAICISAVIRGIVYHIMYRALKITGHLPKEYQSQPKAFGETYMHYMRMITLTHEWIIFGFNQIFYNIYAVVMGLVWSILVVATSWFFFYYEFMVGIWAWGFLHVGIAVIAALVVFVVEYMVTEKNIRTGAQMIESKARQCTLAAIMAQFPLAMGMCIMFYLIFHPMAWFANNESWIAMMAIGGYVVANVAIVFVATTVFSNSKSHHRSRSVDMGTEDNLQKLIAFV